MKKKPRLEFLMCLILAAVLSTSFSVGAFCRPDLDLTDEQKAQLEEIRNSARDEIIPLFEELKGLTDDLEEIILSEEEIDTGEESEASQLIESIIGTRTQIMEIMARAKLESANVLTLEQIKIMVENMEKRRAWRKKRRECWEDSHMGQTCFPENLPD